LEFRDGILAKMPKNKGKYSALVGLSLKELAEADEKYERISVKTLNDKLVALEAFFAWCCTHEFIERNPAKGLMLTDLRRARDQREPYEKRISRSFLNSSRNSAPRKSPIPTGFR
jgi:primosomal protein N''